MIFVKYVLLFFALLSIPTSAPVVNDDGNGQGPSNHLAKKVLNPEAKIFEPQSRPQSGLQLDPASKPHMPHKLNPDAPAFEPKSPPHQGLQPGVLYLIEKDGHEQLVICLEPATDKQHRPIRGKFNTLELVQPSSVTHLPIRERLGDMRSAMRYFSEASDGVGHVFSKYRVKLPSVLVVDEKLVKMEYLGKVPDKGWKLLKQDIQDFKNGIKPSSRGPE